MRAIIGGGRKERGSKKIKYLFGFLEDRSEIQQETESGEGIAAPGSLVLSSNIVEGRIIHSTL
jgi:hypothetical protein